MLYLILLCWCCSWHIIIKVVSGPSYLITSKQQTPHFKQAVVIVVDSTQLFCAVHYSIIQHFTIGLYNKLFQEHDYNSG